MEWDRGYAVGGSLYSANLESDDNSRPYLESLSGMEIILFIVSFLRHQR